MTIFFSHSVLWCVQAHELRQACVTKVILTSTKLKLNGQRVIVNIVPNATFKRNKELKREIMIGGLLNG